jgi:hypothetical protein
MNNGILLACYVESLTTRKDKSIKITLSTQELSEGNAGQIFGLQSKLAAVYISPKETIPQRDIDQVDKVDVEMNGKTQSQRIRAVMFKLWEQGNEGHKEFEAYYRAKTEIIIEHLKSKIL